MQLENVISKRRDEEEALINKAVQITTGSSTITSITSIGTDTAATTAQEYSMEELEQMRDALKLNMRMHANDLKFHVNGLQTLTSDLIDTVCEAYF